MGPLCERVLTRRAALERLATLAAASVAALGCNRAAPPVAAPLPLRAPRFTPRLFTLEQALLVEDLASFIIPETETPGALSAGVPAFIESLVVDVYADADRAAFLAGLDQLNQAAERAHARLFAQCSPSQQAVLLGALIAQTQQALQASSADGREPFFAAFHELTIEGFCRSKLGATRVLQYDAVPGDYQGSVPLEAVGRAWATS
jgi:hypothetical protein